MELTPRCGCDLCSAAIISRAATGRVGSHKFQLPLWVASCSVRGSPPSRSNVSSYVTANVYYVTFRYPRTWCSRVFQYRLFHPWKFGPVFSSPDFSSPAFSVPPAHHQTINFQLGQLSLASLRCRLIEYQLRLGQGPECHLCRVAGNTVWSHMACEFPQR